MNQPALDSRSPEQIVATPSPLEGSDTNKLEYIKAMIDLVRHDVNHVMLYITFGIGVAALFLSQVGLVSMRTWPNSIRQVVCGAIVLELLAAACFFRYIRALHITQMRMTRCIVSVDVIRAASYGREMRVCGSELVVATKRALRYFRPASWRLPLSLFMRSCGEAAAARELSCSGSALRTRGREISLTPDGAAHPFCERTR